MLKKSFAVLLVIITLMSCVRVNVYANPEDYIATPEDETNLINWLYQAAKANTAVAVGSKVAQDLAHLMTWDKTYEDTKYYAGKALDSIIYNDTKAIGIVRDTFHNLASNIKNNIFGLFKNAGDKTISISKDMSLELNIDLFSKNIINNNCVSIDMSKQIENMNNGYLGEVPGTYYNAYTRHYEISSVDIKNKIENSTFYPYTISNDEIKQFIKYVSTLKPTTGFNFYEGNSFVYFIEYGAAYTAGSTYDKYLMDGRMVGIIWSKKGDMQLTTKYLEKYRLSSNGSAYNFNGYIGSIENYDTALHSWIKRGSVLSSTLSKSVQVQYDENFKQVVRLNYDDGDKSNAAYTQYVVSVYHIIPQNDADAKKMVSNYYAMTNNNVENILNGDTINNYYNNEYVTNTILPAAGSDEYNTYNYETNNDYTNVINDYIYNYGDNVTNIYNNYTYITQLPPPITAPYPPGGTPTPTPTPSNPNGGGSFWDGILEWLNRGKEAGESFLNLFDMFDKIKEFINWIKGIFQSILGFFDYLNPFSDNFFLKIALVPSDDFFQKKVEENRERLRNKFPSIMEMIDMSTGMYQAMTGGASSASPVRTATLGINTASTSATSNIPKFEVTLPDSLGGVTVEVIDLTYYDQYRDTIHWVMIIICTYLFIRRMIKKIPRIIHN